MKNLVFSDDLDGQEVVRVFQDYEDYLVKNKEQFPESAYEFAIAEWHYARSQKECPQISKLSSISIREIATKKQPIAIEIEASFVSRFDKQFNIFYKGVAFYSIEKIPHDGVLEEVIPDVVLPHGEWVLDEVYLSDVGLVVHEIEFAFAGRLKVECRDLQFKWMDN